MSKTKIDLLAEITQMLQHNPIFGAGNYPEAARLTANSGRLYRDLLRELEIYNSDPDCDNVRIWHCFHDGGRASYWVNRWGIYVSVFKFGRWGVVNNHLCVGPAMIKTNRPAYINVAMKINGRTLRPLVHGIIADIFIPNDDFTKNERDHINSNHLDNNAFNIERVTTKENNRRKWNNYYTKQGRPVPAKFLPQG